MKQLELQPKSAATYAHAVLQILVDTQLQVGLVWSYIASATWQRMKGGVQREPRKRIFAKKTKKSGRGTLAEQHPDC
jgi:hypothetical protein